MNSRSKLEHVYNVGKLKCVRKYKYKAKNLTWRRFSCGIGHTNVENDFLMTAKINLIYKIANKIYVISNYPL